MALTHIEDCVVENGQIDLYTKVLELTKGPARLVLPLTLDIASYLQKEGLQDQYILFGGYAVLSHLMSVRGEEMAANWRGSEDIDMAGTEQVVRAIKSGYRVTSDRPSPNLQDKRTIKLSVEQTTGIEEECKVDFYTGHFEDKFFPPETNTHFGCELRVSNPLSLIKSKLYTPNREVVHSEDITRLLSVLEHRDYSPEQISRFFRSPDKVQLLERFKTGYEAICSSGLIMDLVPSEGFKKSLDR